MHDHHIRIRMSKSLFLFCLLLSSMTSFGQDLFGTLDKEVPSPNCYRTGAGAPGPCYFQQRADYKIDVEIDEDEKILRGKETIRYFNNSPSDLEYLWIQLDQNIRSEKSEAHDLTNQPISDPITERQWKRILRPKFEGGFNIQEINFDAERKFNYEIVGTLLRIDLEKPLKSGENLGINISWSNLINDVIKVDGRSGYEFFEKDGNIVFAIAQFYPRMAKYDDVVGWENKQYLGQAEFALEFGDFDVSIKVPGDHIVGATGMLVNPEEVLSTKEQKSLKKALKTDQPLFVVDEKEATEKEKTRSKEFKTWKFQARNVRDFAFASSRKFIWEARSMGLGGKRILVQSYYPKEANPLWEMVVTRTMAHAIKTYSSYSFDYPYPQISTVHLLNAGIEYPMISFNGRRPQEDGSFSEYIKNRLIGLIIHEVGHNFFPMVVNSNERKYTWMDEGINAFLEYRSEKEWDPEFPSRRGPAHTILNYMSKQSSVKSNIMTEAENSRSKGSTGYWQPSAALNLLRTQIMGEESFDRAFKVYSERWKFKSPYPADFFRTMEDASGIDLDWFWRSWFFSTDHVDLSIDEVKWVRLEGDKLITMTLDSSILVNSNDSLLRFGEFYTEVTEGQSIESINSMKKVLDSYKGLEIVGGKRTKNIYQLKISSPGGIPSPVFIRTVFTDGSYEDKKYPVTVWRKEPQEIYRVIRSDKEVSHFILDPQEVSTDIDTENNQWPRNGLK